MPNKCNKRDLMIYECKIDAEPIHRYHKGGYHPVHLGDVLNNGTYKVLHKLGWGGYSTVWAARNLKTNEHVAIKISVSERRNQSREIVVLRAIATARSGQAKCDHLMTMQDHFQHHGPNGTHECLVFELLGPSVGDLLDEYFCNERLPAKLAKRIAKQTLLGLCSLHERGIAHGDLYIRNVAFTIPSLHALTEEQLTRKLGTPETGPIKTKDGRPLEPSMPQYLVRPTSYPIDLKPSTNAIKIIDYGQSFPRHDVPEDFNTPLPLRAPEIIFKDTVDYRMDLWSMGCMLFELVVGQPLFDSIMPTPQRIVRQMLESVDDEELPLRWREKWRVMNTDPPGGEPGKCLQVWLEEMYFDGERRAEFSREEILQAGRIVRRMICLEPGMRAEAAEILRDAWFEGD